MYSAENFMPPSLQVVIIKPSKYMADGVVERFRRGFMPNSTVPYMRSMVPAELDGMPIETHAVDEYVHTDLRYLKLLSPSQEKRTLVALVGVQSHQFHRALDLAAYAHRNGCLAIIGGPHVMTCDTSMFHGRGVSFAQPTLLNSGTTCLVNDGVSLEPSAAQRAAALSSTLAAGPIATAACGIAIDTASNSGLSWKGRRRDMGHLFRPQRCAANGRRATQSFW
jgi:hypothetical protein